MKNNLKKIILVLGLMGPWNQAAQTSEWTDIGATVVKTAVGIASLAIVGDVVSEREGWANRGLKSKLYGSVYNYYYAALYSPCTLTPFPYINNIFTGVRNLIKVGIGGIGIIIMGINTGFLLKIIKLDDHKNISWNF